MPARRRIRQLVTIAVLVAAALIGLSGADRTLTETARAAEFGSEVISRPAG